MKIEKFLFLGVIYLLGSLILMAGPKTVFVLVIIFIGCVILPLKFNYFLNICLYIKFRALVWYRDTIGIGCVRDTNIKGFKEIIYYDVITLKKYKVVFPKKRGLSRVGQFQNLESQSLDNTREIEEITGIGGDFHNI